ncbi:MAG: ferritin family protein [Dehalococcoidales bacterium]|nr:ferritin family protein [Candidatus Omnitrophota bacterium]MDD5510479.1 ferritin family protein [Dehalococcoidales bacterium]
MPNFTDPFPGLSVPLRDGDLIRALRLDLAAEEDAIHLYSSHADAAENVMAKTMLLDIANEERVHAGEFLRLIEILTEDERKWMKQGAVEVSNKFPKLAGVGLS